VRRIWRLAALGSMVVAIVPATASASADPPTPPIPARYLTQPIAWSVCPFDATVKQLSPGAPTTNCAKVKVPMDWSAPDAHPDVEVAIAVSRAIGTSRGAMLTNPGGPGAAGLTLSAALAIDKPQLFQDYDLVGFDPRGFGQSTPLQCLTTSEALQALPTTPDYRRRDARTHAVEYAEAELFADACSATEFGQFVSSQQTVYDMELIRRLVDGSRPMHFIGYSYGTWLGGWYADTYPDRVGRFLLDSNMDFVHTQWENVNFDPWSFQRRRDTQLLPWIARQVVDGDVSWSYASASAVLARYEAVRARLVELYEAGTSGVRGDGLDGNVASAIYSNTGFVTALLDILVHDEYVTDPGKTGAIDSQHVERAWARLSPGLQAFTTLARIKARYGVDAPRTLSDVIARARRVATGAPADAVVDLGAIGTTVRCNDTPWDEAPAYYSQVADRQTARYPFFGYLNGVPMCAYWPHPPQDRRVDLRRSPRVMMIQAELDPATAWEGAARTHLWLLRTTHMVHIDDEGQHGQYVGSASACAEQAGDAFVFSGRLPLLDRYCTTSPLPSDAVVHRVRGPLQGNIVLPGARARQGTSKAAERDRRRGSPPPLNPMLRGILDRIAAQLG
jgi:pimeloyl-ACP methyl ester carboxylesterase